MRHNNLIPNFTFMLFLAWKGHYDFKVLGVDVPSHGEQEERLYAIGNSSIYSRGGVLASLRDPVLKVRWIKCAMV